MSGQIIGIKSHVVTCDSCGAWLGRAPLWYSEGDKGDFCPKCGGTSVRVREGRPFGLKCKDWSWLREELDGLFKTFADDDFMLADLEQGLVRR